MQPILEIAGVTTAACMVGLLADAFDIFAADQGAVRAL